MGAGISRVESETVHEKRSQLRSFVSLPPRVGESFWKRLRNIDELIRVSEGHNTTIKMNGNLELLSVSRNGDSGSPSITSSQNNPKCETNITTGKEKMCKPHPSRRRLSIPASEVRYRDNHCCKLPCRHEAALPLEPDESNTETVITLQDSRGTLALPRFRTWQIFPGNNRFFCDGRIITGPDKLVFYLSLGVLNLIFGSFAGIVLPSFGADISTIIALSVTTAFLYIQCTSTMLFCALTDPGIIPRSTRSEVESYMKKNASISHPSGVQPFIRERVNGKEMLRRWCPTCLFYKPPRATHCRECNNCVERFDHHCPFIGNCVGRRNYPCFFAYLAALIVSGIFIISVCVMVVYTKCRDSTNITMTISSWPIICTIVIGVSTIISIIPVSILFYMHTELVSSDLTTNEDLKRSYGNHNPYDRDSKCRNCFSVLCSPRIPSLIRRREFVTRDWMASLEQVESLRTALLQRFGRKSIPDINANKPAMDGLNDNAMSPKSNAEQKRTDQSFVFFHRKSEPDIAKTGGNNAAGDERGDCILEQGSTGNRSDFGDFGYIKNKHSDNWGSRIMEPNLNHLHTPASYMVNILIRKKGTSSENDLGSGSGWNNSQRIGPSYERHTP